MSLPSSHPEISEHKHSGKTCPVTGKGHEWCPPQPGDSRSPCPALNTLANHGYLPRDGKNLSVFDIISALKAGYNLSTFLAAFLTIGGFILLRRLTNVDLYEIGRHGRVEHDASLVHRDTSEGQKYAPISINQRLVDRLIADAKTGDEEGEGPEFGDRRILMDASDVARARIRREKESPRLDRMHAEIARGEMAIILGLWETKAGNNAGVPVEWVREWIGHERLPKDWKPTHVQGFRDVVRRSAAIRKAMEEQRKAEAEQVGEKHPPNVRSGTQVYLT
ncbi:putative peroxidase, family 2 [Lyophyllum shimeji]|uniref:Peroxidase, family 2 n=1 Tax=Lyophyllum shimeji TaxID=47721 RepID=A0A9P3PCE2_LYOSH|nr:putative peroxidase, family 2 [Lyophyllum shimeji]